MCMLSELIIANTRMIRLYSLELLFRTFQSRCLPSQAVQTSEPLLTVVPYEMQQHPPAIEF